MLGVGETVKIVLGKQLVVAGCQASFVGQTRSIVPFRISLAELAPRLGQVQEMSCWLVLYRCLERNYGTGSLHVRALDQALARSKRILLVLDGLDEVQSHRQNVFAWIARLNRLAMVIPTSRPTGVDEKMQHILVGLGFDGRRISGLSP